MKVLMLNPPGPFCRAGSRWPHTILRDTGIDYNPFPFALAYATSRLRADGIDVRIIDCIASRIDLDTLTRQVEEFQPDVIFMETSAPSFREDVLTMKTLGIPCIAGGSHATATPREHLEAGFRAVIRGEYDGVITQAVSLEPAPWLADAEHPDATLAPLVEDLSSVPLPPWDLMPMDKYGDSFCLGFAVVVLSSRGCPHKCSFCNLPHYHGRRNYRPRNPVEVCDEIEQLIERYHPDEIYFDDDTITASKGHILRLSKEIKKRNFGIPFSCMGNVPLDRETIDAMAEAGCRACKFGVESGDPAVLERIPKPLNLDEVRRTFADCRKAGIWTHATYLFGLPGENRESALRTIDFALSLGSNTLQFSIATPYPGTAFYEEARKNGWLVGDGWQGFDGATQAVVSYPGYTADDIKEMHALAWRRWHWHLLLHQQSTLFHHFRNAWKRGGMSGLFQVGRFSVNRLFQLLRDTE